MAVIEVLFKEIDEYNAKIKCSNNLDEKYCYAELIGDIVNAIKDLGRYRHSDQPFLYKYKRYKDENDYI